MSRVAIFSVRLATTDESGAASPGIVSRILAYHGVYTATGTASAGPTLAQKATGFLVKGVEGSTLFRIKGVAALAGPLPDQMLIFEGDSEYVPAKFGDTTSVIEIV